MLTKTHAFISLAFTMALIWGVANADESPVYQHQLPHTLKSASELDYPPLAIVSADGQADGFSVELLRAAVQAMGHEVVFHVGPWNDIKNELAEGKIDVLPLVGRTPERERIYDFTIPYFSLHGTVIVRRGSEPVSTVADLKSRQVAVMKGDNAEEYLRREAISNDIVTTDSFEDALIGLSRGRYDAVVVDHVVGLRLIRKLGLDNLEEADPHLRLFRQDFSFAVREGNRALLALLNEGLALVMSNGTHHRLLQKWMRDEYAGQGFSYFWTVLLSILLGALIVGIAAFIWLRILRHMVKVRTTELKREVDTRREAELRLAASEERFLLAMAATNDGIFDWNLETNQLYFSRRWKSMLGYEDSELENAFTTWEEGVHPDDIAEAKQAIDDYLQGRRAEYQVEFRMRHKDGHWVDILSRGYVVRNEQGKPLRMVGTHVDISQRKLAERHLERERNRAQHYLDIAGIMMLALDSEGRIVLINRKGCEVLGLPEEALLGQYWFDKFILPEDVQQVRRVFRQLMAGHVESLVEYYENEIINAQGERRLIAWHNSVTRDESGEISGLLSSGEDVTEERRAEQLIEQERAFLQDVIDGVEDPIMVINPEFEVLRMNRAAQNIARGAGVDFGSAKCHQISHFSMTPCSSEDHPCPLRMVLEEGKPVSVMHRHFNAEGVERTFEVSASPLRNSAGEIEGIIEVSHDITSHLELQEELQQSELSYTHLVHYDPLTELPNRSLFTDRLGHAIHVAHRNQFMFAVLIIGLDGFQKINDSFDHRVGDEVLKIVGQRMGALVREDDTFARLGGDEFALLLHHIRQESDAAIVAHKMMDQFQKPMQVGGHEIFIGASIGIGLYPAHGETVEELIRNADAALHRAKAEGRKNFQYYTSDLTARAFERVLLETSLRKALDEQEFVLYYQPQFNFPSQRITGMEALVRWQHPEMGLVPPDKFIPLAEESGIIIPMGEWILEESCRQMKAWLDSGTLAPDALMCVNLSSRQFDQPDLIDIITAAIGRSSLPAANLELEITESTVAHSPETTIRVLKQLRELGCKVAIDDFGTGYSSLSSLKNLPFTKLKIDRSFIKDIPHDQNDVAISRAVIALGKSLSLEVLAEGIETEEQHAFLVAEGCDTGQGYLISRPLPAADVERFMQAQRR